MTILGKFQKSAVKNLESVSEKLYKMPERTFTKKCILIENNFQIY